MASVLRAAELAAAEPDSQSLRAEASERPAGRARVPRVDRSRRAVDRVSSLVGSRVGAARTTGCSRGEGRYLADLAHGASAAAFVRSPHAHARVVDVDVTDALDVDGLVGDLHVRGPRWRPTTATAPGWPSGCRCSSRTPR